MPERSGVRDTRVPGQTGSANRLMLNITRTLLIAAAACAPLGAHASFLTPEKLDVAAFYLAWFIIIVFPIAGTILFLMVHMLPEKIAERRHHPQKEAIKTLTILSLIFGGMLWPICWLWAYVRPTSYRAVYGTTKHEDYYYEMGEEALAGKLSEAELAHLREEIDDMAETGTLPLKLKQLRKDLAAAQAAPAGSGAKAGSV
jgi:hypothetical protein